MVLTHEGIVIEPLLKASILPKVYGLNHSPQQLIDYPSHDSTGSLTSAALATSLSSMSSLDPSYFFPCGRQSRA